MFNSLVKFNNIELILNASCSFRTDALIQKTIRQKFADCTVLTVAHRLNTIMDSDKVLVMEAGTMAEYNHPHILLQNNKSKFAKMVTQTGNPMADQLRRIAKHSYQDKNEVPENAE